MSSRTQQISEIYWKKVRIIKYFFTIKIKKIIESKGTI